MALNKVLLIGNLGRDPEVKMVGSKNTAVASFSLATNEKYNGETKTAWHNVNVWGKAAEIAEKYLRKGDQAGIEGKIEYQEWTDKEGNKRTKTVITALNIILLGSNRRQTAQAGNEPAFEETLESPEVPF